MKKILITLCSLALALASVHLNAAPLGTAFTYQGRLADGANPANGRYDLQCAVYDAVDLGNRIGNIVTNTAVAVSNGLFTVSLDFGANVFTGNARWLAIGVRSNGVVANFTPLDPRQSLTPAPYAIYAPTAGAVTNGSVMASQLKTTNAPGAGQVLTYDGLSLLWQTPAAASGAWAIGGNNVVGGSFLGTLNDEPLEVRVKNARAFRLEPTTGAPNVILGHGGNTVSNGVMAASIGGGEGNSVGGDHSTIAGGNGNSAGSNAAFVGGGSLNHANGSSSTLAGGYDNTVSGGVGTIGGGARNRVNAGFGMISGGENNAVDGDHSAVVGGNGNSTGSNAAFVGGGSFNHANGSSSTIAGGYQNTASGSVSFIGGGENNRANDSWTTIAGGQNNTASGGSGSIGGGSLNQVIGPGSTVAGGILNVAGAVGGGSATVGGGFLNTASGFAATVPGGVGNVASGGDSMAAGQNAHATHDNTFVWGDGTRAFNSAGPHTFDVLATGGVNLFTTFLTVSGSGNEQAYIGGDGVGAEVQIGSLNPDISNIALYNATTGHYMNCYVGTLTITGGADLAEPFQMSTEEIPKGAVVVIDEDNAGKLKLSTRVYDNRVAGIVSGANGINPGIALHQEGVIEGGQNVALSGRVYAQADASNSPIKPGDLLTTSNTPGHAMKVTDHAKAQGAILGKAMSVLKEGKGMVLVLVSLQ